MTAAAVAGTLADMRLDAPAGVLRLIVEVPIGDAADAIESFAGERVPVALARLNPSAVGDSASTPDASGPPTASAPRKMSAEKGEHGRRPFDSLSLREQCCILCRSSDFQDFAFSTYGWLDGGDPSEAAATIVRRELGVRSRRDLDTNKRAGEGWKAMRAKFEAAKRPTAERRW